MNVFELLTLVAMGGSGYLLGRRLGASYGVGGWLAGVLVGGALALLFYVALRRAARVTGQGR